MSRIMDILLLCAALVFAGSVAQLPDVTLAARTVAATWFASNMRPSEEEAWVKMAKSGELARFLGTDFACQYQARLSAVAVQIEREKREAGRTNP